MEDEDDGQYLQSMDRLFNICQQYQKMKKESDAPSSLEATKKEEEEEPGNSSNSNEIPISSESSSSVVIEKDDSFTEDFESKLQISKKEEESREKVSSKAKKQVSAYFLRFGKRRMDESSDDSSSDESSEDAEAAKYADVVDEPIIEPGSDLPIPPEQQIAPAAHVSLLKPKVSKKYLRDVLKHVDYMPKEQLEKAVRRITTMRCPQDKKRLRVLARALYRKERTLQDRVPRTLDHDSTLKHFDFLIAVDFECTCQEIVYNYPHEIIEFAAVLIDCRKYRIVSHFRSFVRPFLNPILSKFCTDFTKINQSTVDNAPYFREALAKFDKWMRDCGMGRDAESRFAFVTDGPHDMWKFMQLQCAISGISMPHMFRSFINIKRAFENRFGMMLPQKNGKSGIQNMLELLGLTFQGQAHSGLHDARNIATIVCLFLKGNFEFMINQRCAYLPLEERIKQNGRKKMRPLPLEQVEPEKVISADFEIWKEHLPMKLMRVRRDQFLDSSYLDCESCDDLTDDENDEEAHDRNMAIRAELDLLQDKEDEEYAAKNAEIQRQKELGIYEEERKTTPKKPKTEKKKKRKGESIFRINHFD
ncbi:unnamed protein product [Caenorhabditis sp. 36 PRJEB53466]|nr:unnamed protein product [Caenorhabditis sp. 36 PRJEB53466]